jgi:hypothetical protein
VSVYTNYAGRKYRVLDVQPSEPGRYDIDGVWLTGPDAGCRAFFANVTREAGEDYARSIGRRGREAER